MMTDQVNVFEWEREGSVLLVIPQGSMMEFRDDQLRNAYNDTYRMITEPSVQHLLVDFSKMAYFGSTFVGMLIRLAKKIRLDGGEAVLCNLSDNMKDLMKTMMLLENQKTDFYWVPHDNREGAMAFLQGKSAE